MSYTITARVFQTDPSTHFEIVEKTVWHYANGGTWTDINGAHVLSMGGSGTSGTIRFQSSNGNERFIVALGVHNYKRWVDIVTGLSTDATGVVINQEYYGDNSKRGFAREKQLADYSVTSSAGTKVQVKYTVADGNNLKADIIIGGSGSTSGASSGSGQGSGSGQDAGSGPAAPVDLPS